MRYFFLFLASIICLAGCSKNYETEQATIDQSLLVGAWETVWPTEYSQHYTFYETGSYTERITFTSGDLSGESFSMNGTYTLSDGVLTLTRIDEQEHQYRVTKLNDSEMIWKIEWQGVVGRDYIDFKRKVNL